MNVAFGSHESPHTGAAKAWTQRNGERDSWARLQGHLADEGRDAAAFPNALATMWFHITDDREEADRVVRDRLVPAIHRPEAELRERLPVGPPGAFAQKLNAFREAGAQQVLVWPVVDEARQLELFCDQVVPHIG